jgi:hypothetical protein
MKIHYHLANLSRDEWERLQIVLQEEIDMQSWFAVSFSKTMNQELILTIQ